MPHYHAKIWVHLITATKNRSLLIDPSSEQEIYGNMWQELLLLGCPTDVINGMPDHVHSLFLLNPKHALSSVIQQVKGSTSHWINDKKLLAGYFAWQTGYAAYSVSESRLETVRRYILNQKEHHKNLTLAEESNWLSKLHGD